MQDIVLPVERQSVLIAACCAVAHVPGPVAELGVYRGGSAALIAGCLPMRDLHLFDTFVGLPAEARSGRDRLEAGKFGDTSEATVAERLQGYIVHLHAGLFPESAEGLEDLRFALVHIDADYYHSTRDGLWWFGERIVPGGVMLLDDWQQEDTPGVTQAVTDFRRDADGWRFLEPSPRQALFVREGNYGNGHSSR